MSSRLSGPPPHAQGARSPAVAPAGEPTRLTRGTWLRRVSVPISSPVAGEPTAPSCGGPAFRRFRPAPRRLWLVVFGCFSHGFILASGGVYWGWWPVPATSHGEGATPLGVTPGPASPSGLPPPPPRGTAARHRGAGAARIPSCTPGRRFGPHTGWEGLGYRRAEVSTYEATGRHPGSERCRTNCSSPHCQGCLCCTTGTVSRTQ